MFVCLFVFFTALKVAFNKFMVLLNLWRQVLYVLWFWREFQLSNFCRNQVYYGNCPACTSQHLLFFIMHSFLICKTHRPIVGNKVHSTFIQVSICIVQLAIQLSVGLLAINPQTWIAINPQTWSLLLLFLCRFALFYTYYLCTTTTQLCCLYLL